MLVGYKICIVQRRRRFINPQQCLNINEDISPGYLVVRAWPHITLAKDLYEIRKKWLSMMPSLTDFVNPTNRYTTGKVINVDNGDTRRTPNGSTGKLYV